MCGQDLEWGSCCISAPLPRIDLYMCSPSVANQWSRLNSRVYQEQEDGDSHCYCGNDTEYGDVTQCPREGDDDADDCSDHVEGHGAESGIRKRVEDLRRGEDVEPD
jgi:hypothetical protein